MRLDHRDENILVLVKDGIEGKLALPDFQRHFIWSRSDIEELLSSMLENMFIGSFLIQEVSPSEIPFNPIPIEGTPQINPHYNLCPRQLLLDGQQRITSLIYALYSPELPLKNTSNPYAFFIDLEALENNDIENATFSWSKRWREYKEVIDGNGNFIIERLVERKILPVKFLRPSSSFEEWDSDEIWYEYFHSSMKNAQQVRKYLQNFKNFKIHSLVIPASTPPEEIVSVFEKINRTGVKLSTFDLLTARFHSFLNLRKEWAEEFENSEKLRELALGDPKNTKIPYYIIQGIALSKGKPIKAKELIKIDKTILNQDSWKEALEVLKNRILVRLFEISEYGIPKGEWIPYPSILPIILALFLLEKQGKLAVDINKLNNWYWATVFNENVELTDDKLLRHFRELKIWFQKKNAKPLIIEELKNNIKVLNLNTKNRGSSLYKGVFNLLFKRGAFDFFKVDKLQFRVEELEDHHIFPKRYLKLKGLGERADIVLNRTLIFRDTNRRISSKAPSDYIEEMKRIHQGREEIEKILKPHFINDEMITILEECKADTPPRIVRKHFETFLKKRKGLIKEEIKRLVNIK